MNRSVMTFLVLLFTVAKVLAADSSVVEAVRASADVPLQTDPASVFWSAAHPAYLEKDKDGRSTSHFRSEVRTRWTKENLNFLFVCPYDELYLKPSPTTAEETNELWN